MDSTQGYVRRTRLPPSQSVDPSKEVGLKLLASLSSSLAIQAPSRSAVVLTATSELLSALPPLRMFKSLAPRCPPEEVLPVIDGMVSR